MCPICPFSARSASPNTTGWLSEGIDSKQCSNAFLKCSDPGKLQELAAAGLLAVCIWLHWVHPYVILTTVFLVGIGAPARTPSNTPCALINRLAPLLYEVTCGRPGRPAGSKSQTFDRTWYLPCPTSKNYWWYAEAFGKGS
jgi:hypothetical protein